MALPPRVERPLAPRSAAAIPGLAPVIEGQGASGAANVPTLARIALARGKIGVTHGRTRRKIGPSIVKTEGRTFAMNSRTTIPALTSGRTIRMQPSGA